MDFNLEALGWKNFEDLALTIVRHQYEVPIRKFSAGPDGGRDGAAILVGQTDQPVPGRSIAIQCKHSSTRRSLTLASFKSELRKIKRLVSEGLSDIYFLITNLRLSGRSDAAIYRAIRACGVQQVHIIGRDTIEHLLTEDKTLRALVPRVYGLGDFSEILDERAYLQTHQLVRSYEPNRFVPTTPYFQTIESLHAHSFALLLGDPGSGKSTIMAMAAIHASDYWRKDSIWLERIEKLSDHWNPSHPGQLFLLDDAFGNTNMDMSRVQAWNQSIPFVRGAINGGARLILTSRTYVFVDARPHLKQYELPVLHQAEVVIKLDSISTSERRQIVYNHLKHGNQPKRFLSAVKPHLNRATRTSTILPVAAARLGDKEITRDLDPEDLSALARFLLEPREYLQQVIASMHPNLQNALLLLMAMGGRLDSQLPQVIEDSEIWTRLAMDRRTLTRSLQSLEGSFVYLNVSEPSRIWEVKHPSVFDAVGDWILRQEDLLDLYVRYSPLHNLAQQISCGDYVRGSVQLPEALWDTAIERLTSHSYDAHLAIRFLAYRCKAAVLARPEILHRIIPLLDNHPFSTPLDGDPGLRLFLRLEVLGLLADEMVSSIIESVVLIGTRHLDSYLITNDSFQEILLRIDPHGEGWLNVIDRYVAELDSQLEDFVANEISRHLGEVSREDVFAGLLALLSVVEEWLQDTHPLIQRIEATRGRIGAWCSEPVESKAVLEDRMMHLLRTIFAMRLEDRDEDIFADLDD